MTNKQKQFALEYLKDCNATAAAKRAGYSEKTAKVQGCKMLALPEVKAFIDEEMKKLESKKVADAKEIIEYLTSVIRGEIEDELYVQEGSKTAKKEVVSPTRERNKAAELLMKHLRMFDSDINVKIKNPITIVDDIPDEEDEDEE
jgi:phage terminase small subunit